MSGLPVLTGLMSALVSILMLYLHAELLQGATAKRAAVEPVRSLDRLSRNPPESLQGWCTKIDGKLQREY